MAEYIVMPKLGFDMREAVLSNWLKQEGEQVEKGEIVAEIESDKATLELESQVSGVLLKQLAASGDVVPVGGNLAIVGEEDEDVSAMDGDGAAPQTEARPEPKGTRQEPRDEVEPSEEAAKEEEESEEADAPPAAAGADGEPFPGGARATPVARRIAREHEIDLGQVKGSGPDGRIRKSDIESYLEGRREEPAPAAAPAGAEAPARAEAPVFEPVAAGPESEEVPASRLRQAIGRRMVESKTAAPHFYVTTEVDMDPALALRKQINAMLPEDEKVSVNDLIVKAAALALRDFPNLNASFGGDKIIRHKRINVGTAVAVEGGLLTVVQQNTDHSTLTKIAGDNRIMIARAREGKMRPEDVENSTFTVSNLGAYDVDHFVAIINPPEAAILAVGTARQVPVVVDGELRAGTRMKATISADHRVSDGAEAARFLQQFKALLEEPMRLLI
jgi:pyruvate dehydrogenase E2 component (dihydrolipoamide acetyltransferase)